MIFTETRLKGAFLIALEKITDRRGFFARTWCEREFAEHGLNPKLMQANLSLSTVRHTLRGMHYQAAPFAEAKLVRCTAGAIYDVIIDLRPESETFRQWLGVTLNAESGNMLYVPEGFAHGFLTLANDTGVFYQMSERYSAEHARGVRWNDPAFGIQWPGEIALISDKDSQFPDFSYEPK